MKEVQALVHSPGVLLAKTDQCMFGHTTVDDGGQAAAVRKRTGFLTNCRELHDELSVVCDKSHSHGSLLGKGRAGCAAVYYTAAPPCTRRGWLQPSYEVFGRPWSRA